MPNFLEFVKTHQGDETTANNLLIALSERPPSYDYYPKQYPFSKNYTEDAKRYTVTLSLVINELFERFTYSPNSIDIFGKVYGLAPPKTVKEMMICYFFSRAAIFKATKIGECSYRACYSGWQLREIFSTNKALSVTVTSAPKRDQFVVMCGNKNIGWYVYDPLTNPDMIFPHTQYQEQILPTFPLVTNPKSSFILKITAEIANDLTQQWPIILPIFHEVLSSMLINTNAKQLYAVTKTLSKLSNNTLSLNDGDEEKVLTDLKKMKDELCVETETNTTHLNYKRG